MSDETGRCLCGAVSYRVTGPLRNVIYCHCEQCRRTSGHYVAASAAANADLVIEERSGLAWYASSDAAERGFCKVCGSSLFWRQHAEDFTSICAGSLDRSDAVQAERHIFVASKGAYYDVNDTLPQHAAQ